MVLLSMILVLTNLFCILLTLNIHLWAIAYFIDKWEKHLPAAVIALLIEKNMSRPFPYSLYF